MNPRVSIIMGSTSDLAIMEKAAKVLDDMGIPFEMNALSAHRTPAEVEAFAKQAAERGIEVIIAGAGMAATGAGDRGADQRLFERNGCFVGYYSDASGNSCRYSGYQRSDECWNSRRTNIGCRRSGVERKDDSF